MNREPARVLVVDDEPEFRQYVASLLAESNCLVSCADDGGRAVHLLRCADTPDLIICDMHMPRLDGLALLEQVRRRPETEHTPVIFVSGDSSERIHALEQGANDFMMKPLDPQELVARVNCQLRVTRTSRAWRQHSFIDPLTGLLNRRGFSNQIAREIDRATRHHTSLAVVFMDLDGFKAVNDVLGHEVGDQILERFAGILEQNLRGSDLAVRWGGDEFVLGLPGSDRAAAARVAARVNRTSEAAFKQLPLRLGVSVGISCLFEDAHGSSEAVANELIRAADRAMYRDKEGHRRQGNRQFARGSNPRIPTQPIRPKRATQPLPETKAVKPRPRRAKRRSQRQTQEWHPSRTSQRSDGTTSRERDR